MKILWTGGSALIGRGVLIVESGESFRAIGPGQTAEVTEERGKLLIAKGLASPNLAAAEDLDPLTAEELADLKETGKIYSACHAAVLEDLARRRAAAKVRASA